MSEINPAPNHEQPVPKFRLNAHVFQILGLLAVALALPITMLVLALSDMRGKGQKEAAAELPKSDPSGEVSGLRESLESIAEANLPKGPIETSMRIFRLRVEKPAQRAEKASEILNFLKQTEPGFVESGDSEKPIWIATIPANQISDFEKSLMQMGFSDERGSEGIAAKKSAAAINEPVVYRIYLDGGL